MARYELIVVATMCLIFGNWEIHAIKCYVCTDCEIYYNETHLIDCAEGEERCLKRDMMDEKVERGCGQIDDCKASAGGDIKKGKKTGSEAYTNKNKGGKPRRFVRQLLQTAPIKEDKVEIIEFISLNCCNEDECNGAFSQFLTTSTVPTLACTLLATLYFLPDFLTS